MYFSDNSQIIMIWCAICLWKYRLKTYKTMKNTLKGTLTEENLLKAFAGESHLGKLGIQHLPLLVLALSGSNKVLLGSTDNSCRI